MLNVLQKQRKVQAEGRWAWNTSSTLWWTYQLEWGSEEVWIPQHNNFLPSREGRQHRKTLWQEKTMSYNLWIVMALKETSQTKVDVHSLPIKLKDIKVVHLVRKCTTHSLHPGVKNSNYNKIQDTFPLTFCCFRRRDELSQSGKKMLHVTHKLTIEG